MRSRIGLAAGLTLGGLTACGEPSPTGLAVALQEARFAVEAPGAIVGVRYPDGKIELAASGLADVGTGRPIATGDAFFLGSISKVYTAALVLRLVDEGALELEDPLSRHLPDFPRGDEITVRHLLEHTSGLKDFYLYLYLRPDREEMIERVTRTWSQEEMLELAGRFGHWFDPGADWAYSNTNYFLLGVLAERAAGASLPELYRTYLLGPLGLDRTWLTLYEEARAELPISGYMGRVEGWEHSAMFAEADIAGAAGGIGATTLLDRSNLEWGAGGLAAPAEEALAFLAALMEGELLPPGLLERMLDFRPTEPLGAGEGVAGDDESGYGLGLVRMRRAGYEAVGHGGLFTGHTAGLWHLPDEGVTIALFLNRGFVGQRRALDRIVAHLLGYSGGD